MKRPEIVLQGNSLRFTGLRAINAVKAYMKKEKKVANWVSKFKGRKVDEEGTVFLGTKIKL